MADTLKQCYTAPVRDGLRGWGLHLQSIADQWVQRARDNELDRFPAQIRRFEAIWAGNERLLHHVGHKGPEPIASVAQTPFMLAAATFLINRNEFFKRYDRGAYDHVGKMAPTDRAQFNDLMDALEVCDNAAEADQILGRLHTFAQRTSPAPLRRF
ncbi:hypothetical protein CDN99_20730 [Roseateles aquatilis]|uniref:Uncharacterized protein n=1 Tax=Roseateles aquatilis TaxID=431061 RepID=A0A246J1B9_9BURK|nr:hypothetical protein CDN99_20730 [Roseateles aquatilis]